MRAPRIINAVSCTRYQIVRFAGCEFQVRVWLNVLDHQLVWENCERV